ncbi:signal recognition particle-docking protein FtsY [Bifidobacterium adolescentis]
MIAIVAVVVIAALLAIGGWWFGKSRKSAVSKSTEAAKAKADARLAAEAAAAKADASESAESESTETKSSESESPVENKPAPAEPAVTEPAKPVETVPAEPEAAENVPVPAIETPEAAGTRMQRLKARLSKSGNPFGKALFNILAKDQLSEADWEDVEDTLLLADVGAEASEQLVEELRNDARIAGQSDPAEVRAALKDKLLKLVGTDTDRRLNANKEGANKPSVIIMVGVNGTGKTTTAGKLSRLLVSEGKQVMLGAADTFRAAAADQLETWGAKVGVPVVRSDKDGADPASVAFEASAKAKEENADVLIIDTAGRLQNKANLMDELGKIRRVTEKNLPVDEVLLVLDATTGQNGMTQAKVFAEAIGITGVVLSKLDGSAKGGIVISVQKELGVPVKLVGLGEGPDDLAPFDPEGFVDGILA